MARRVTVSSRALLGAAIVWRARDGLLRNRSQGRARVRAFMSRPIVAGGGDCSAARRLCSLVSMSQASQTKVTCLQTKVTTWLIPTVNCQVQDRNAIIVRGQEERPVCSGVCQEGREGLSQEAHSRAAQR